MADEGADILLVTEAGFSTDTLSSLSATAHQTKATRISTATSDQPVPVPIFVAAAPHLSDIGLPTAIPAGCFLQSSQSAEAEMQQHIRDALAGYNRIVDLFCGVGTFSAPLLSASRQIFAADNDEMAVAAYRQAAHNRGWHNRLALALAICLKHRYAQMSCQDIRQRLLTRHVQVLLHKCRISTPRRWNWL